MPVGPLQQTPYVFRSFIVIQFSIQFAMPKFCWMLILAASWMHAQVPAPGSSSTESAGKASTAQQTGGIDDDSSSNRLTGKVSLVRGVLKKVDPIHDQLWVHTFGGGDVRIGFDGRTRFSSDSTSSRLTSIPIGTVLSVDTQIADGKLFARSVRTGTPDAVELSGQVVGFDASRSQLTLHDPMSPENISLRITPTTTIVNSGQAGSAQNLPSGALVKVWFSAPQRTANRIEILAERGGSFTFQGRIVSVDLRSHLLSISNDTDQSLRELFFGTLDANSLHLLREGADVSIQAEFDGDRYNVRSVTPATRNP
jgi:hypothetical protein